MDNEEKSEEESLEPEEEILEEEGLQERLKKMRKELESCRKEKEEYLAGWQRAKADFINARKDEERGREAFLKFAGERILREFLVIGDSLELALKLKSSEGSPADLSADARASAKAGLEQIYSQFWELLKQHGVTPIESVGKKFNPLEHESLEEEEVSEEAKDNMVQEELQKGWMLHERVLRPAKVKVGVYRRI